MIAKIRKRGDKFYMAIAVAVLLTISLVSAGLLGVVTGAFAKDEDNNTAAINPPQIVDVKSVPMSLAMDATIDKNDSGWGKRDQKKLFTLPPFPFSCASNAVNPSYSATQGYNASSAVTLTINGYSAGLGALAFKENIDKPGRCVGGNTSVTTSAVNGLGTEAVLVTSRRAGITNQSIVWRRGDVISYLSSEGGDPVEFAKIIDRNLSSNISGKCVNENSTIADIKRTVWSSQYEGYRVPDSVLITKASLPKVPATDEKLYEVTAIPSGQVEVVTVSAPAVPTHPVWPKLPASVTAPQLPKSPAPEAPFKKDVIVTKEDVDGPGCGWVFTGTGQPTFDKAVTDANNESTKAAAKIQLESESSAWSKSVLEYWKATKVFTEQSKAYSEYATKVTEVSVAWAGIQQKWDTYNANMLYYNQTVADNTAFLANQKTAQTDYDSKLEQCKLQDERQEQERNKPTPSPSPTATAGPEPTGSPTATPTATPTPTSEPVPTIQCPPSKPVILSQEAPKIVEKPQPPANPIPESER